MRNCETSESIQSFGPKPTPADALSDKYGHSRAAVIINELSEKGYDIVAEEAKSYSTGAIFVFPRTKSMSDPYWYRFELATVLVSGVLWLIATCSLPDMFAVPVGDAIAGVAVCTAFFYRNATARLLLAASAGAILLYVYLTWP